MSHKKPDLPAPFKEGGRNYWRKGDIRRWLAERAGIRPPAPQLDDEFWVNSAQLREMCGGVSHMWIERRRADRGENAKARNAEIGGRE